MSLSACGDGPTKRRVGETCGFDEDCAGGLCVDSVCIDPAADDDLDTVLNGVEVTLGTDPGNADSDGDQKDDASELGPGFAPKDSDGDGILDALESALTDADKDCLVDEVDARNAVPDGETSPDLATVCPHVGVCAAAGATLAVWCPTSPDAPACDFRQVPYHEAPETACDTRDNDCDGTTDAGCDPLVQGLLGHWPLDGDGKDVGPYKDDGTVEGAVAAPDRFGAAGKALRFTADGDRVVAPTTHHPLDGSDVSYTVWVRPDASADLAMTALSFGEIAADKRSALALGDAAGQSSGRRCAGYRGGGHDGDSATACAPPAHWSLLAVVKTGTKVQFWLDGRLQDEVTVTAGQALARTVLSIGNARVFASGVVLEQFRGALDDVRLYGRALSASDLAALFSTGGWTAAGTATNAGQSCLHVRDAAGATSDGLVTLDTDGDGPHAAFSAWCDQTRDGGGWTLAWVYGFTAFDTFTDAGNAVAPIPSWPASLADVTVSTTAPASPSSAGAIDWTTWEAIGTSFLATTDLGDTVACDDIGGSFATGVEGPVDCRIVGAAPSSCPDAVPDWVFFGAYGPGLSAENLFYYFDGSTSENWPTHDPCGTNGPPAVAAPAREGGALFLR
ncbi:MAG: LamG-like jellyroll fold domain-containing protein [Myxococcota bacterium]